MEDSNNENILAMILSPKLPALVIATVHSSQIQSESSPTNVPDCKI